MRPKEPATANILNEKTLLKMTLKDELDVKKVRILELETENGEMKTMIEHMAREVKILKETTEKKALNTELDQSEQVYELRRENFRLAADVRRLQLENEMLRSGDVGKKEEASFHEIARLENQVDDLKSEKSSIERDGARVLAKMKQMDV